MEREPVKIEAETVDEAIKRAASLLKATPGEIEVEVLDEGSRGLLGLYRRPAVILARLKAAGEEKSEEGRDEGEGLLQPDLETGGYGWIKDGKLFLKGTTPVTIVPTPHFELYVNGQLVGGEVEVTAQDRIEIQSREEIEKGSWQLLLKEEGLTAALFLLPGRKRTWKLLDQLPASRLELKGEVLEEPLPPVTWEDLQEELKRKNIVHGLDHEALREACQRVEPGEVVIARGKAPRPPEDGWIEYLFDLRETKWREVGEEERVDYRELVERSSVAAGEVLAIKHPPQPGEPGLAVTGELLPPPPPKDVLLTAGKGVVLSEDGQRCIAATEGRPRAIKRGNKVIIEVTPVLVHEGDVNLASGNLKFKGSIIISGNVTETMTVVASQDVEVKGDVTQATIQAGGSILVRRNVISSTLVAGDTGCLLVNMAPLFDDLSTQLRQLLQALTQLQACVECKDGYLINVLIENKFKKLPDLISKLENLSKNIKDGPEEEKLVQLIHDLFQAFRSPASRQNLAQSELRELLQAVEEMALYCREMRAEGGHVTANYALNSRIHAQGNVKIVGRGCFNTEIVAGGNIEINGVFRAGKLYAEGNVYIQEMGSSGGAKTLARVAEGRTIKVGKIWPNCALQIGKRIRQIDTEENRVMAYLNSEGELILGIF